MSSVQRSFVTVSEENHRALLQYIERINSASLKLPSHQGKVNKTAVARACGFARETFQQNERFAQTLAAAVKRLGIEMPSADEPEPRSNEDKARIMRLEQQTAALRSENYDLRRRLRRYEAIADHMAGTGRRVGR